MGRAIWFMIRKSVWISERRMAVLKSDTQKAFWSREISEYYTKTSLCKWTANCKQGGIERDYLLSTTNVSMLWSLFP